MEELLDFINKVDEHLVQQDTNHDPKIHSLIASIKLSEEVGEFNEQLLWYRWYGRKEKIEKYSQEDMEHEMADIIFSALMLAKSLNIDVNKSLSNKMKKIKERFNIQ